MNIFNGQWISVPTQDREGHSHIRLRDIHRIAVNKSIARDGDRYSVTLFANGTEYIYSKGKALGDAELDAKALLDQIVKVEEVLTTVKAT
jgi:predicted metal-dependent hydrolase